MRFDVIERDGAGTPVDVDIEQGVIGGYTGRDTAAVQEHIDELAEIGVPAPSTTPLFYRVSANLLTQDAHIQKVGAGGSGEVEAELIATSAGVLVAVGSDHTDRDAESYSVALSKQLCAKPISRQASRLEDLMEAWDETQLATAQETDGQTRDYQAGKHAAYRSPEEMVRLSMANAALAAGPAMSRGTLSGICEIADGDAFAMRPIDTANGDRMQEHAYRVEALPNAS